MSSTGRRTVLLFVFFQALYALTSSGNVFRVPDEFEVYFQAEHLVDAGDLSVPQTLALRQPVIDRGRVVGSTSMFFGEIARDGKPYAPYGPLVAYLAVPFHLFGRMMAAAAGVPRAPLPQGIAWLVVAGGFTMLATAMAGALTVAGFHRAIVALCARDGEAVVLPLLLGATTVLWPYGTSFFSEAWQAAAFVWAAALLLEARARSGDRGAAARVAIAATLIAIAGLTKVTSLIFAPGFLVAVLLQESMPLRKRIETTAALALAMAFAASVHVAWNLQRFGKPFDFGYDWGETIPRPPARGFLLTDIPRGLTVLLLTPGKSLVVWAPILILTAFAARAFWRRERGVAAGVAVSLTVGLLFYAAYLFPEGGYAHGPRNLVPILPLLLLPASVPGILSRHRRLAVICAGVGFVIAFLATAVSFLEDQSLGADLNGRARTVYYERFDPPPGRVWNRYRLDYIPFVDSMTSPGWLRSAVLGQGPDYFPLHLLQARRQAPNGNTIPLWLVWMPPLLWSLILVAAAIGLRTDVAGVPRHSPERAALQGGTP